MKSKILRLIKNPKKEYKNIFSFFKRNWGLIRPGFFEFFGVDKYSKPYPQHTQLLKHLNFNNGFFVEVGGNDGFSFDPTYYLEKFKGWKGVIVEPLDYAKKCKKKRNKSFVYNCAAGNPVKEGDEVEINDCGPMSVISGNDSKQWVDSAEKFLSITAIKKTVKIFSLTYLLDEFFKKNYYRDFDLLVVDVEGYEVSVIKGLDFSLYAPKYILIEAHTQTKLDEIIKCLPGQYLLIEKLGAHDYLFKNN